MINDPTKNTKPLVLEPILDAIPAELKQQPRWVTWRLEQRGGKWTKIPYDPNTQRKAKANEPRTWVAFDTAVTAYKSNGYDGVGYEFSTDGTEAGVDLDRCRNAETGIIEPWAQTTIDLLDSYTEVSPSGTGVKIIIRFAGELPGKRRRKGQTEMYLDGRFFTLTGHHIEGTPTTIEDRTEQLTKLYHVTFDNEPISPVDGDDPTSFSGVEKNTSKAAATGMLSDDELIKIARDAKNGPKFDRLLRGDLDGYGSHSEADLGLCSVLAFYAGPNGHAQIDRIFRMSGLYREKWERQDYRDGTIAKALEGTSEFYTAGGSAFEYTDLGNARRLVHHFGDQIRYSGKIGWLAWDGRRWAKDETGQISRYAKRIADGMLRKAVNLDDTDKKKKLVKWALKSQAVERIAAMIRLAQTEAAVAIDTGALDTDPWLLNLLNGTLNLRTSEFREHRQTDLITKLAPVEYDETAESALWTSFLERILGGDTLLIAYMQRAIGYAMTGVIREQVLQVLFGSGSNGKSTFIDAIETMLGDYAQPAPPDLIILKKTENHPTELADLWGARFVSDVEIGEAKRMHELRVKRLTGKDRIKARFMRKDFFSFYPTHKLFIATNNRPVIHGQDHAIWRRIKLIPFTVRIPDEDQDKALAEKLKAPAALSAILNWAMTGCTEWQAKGLDPPESVEVATAEYREDMDILAEWLADCCTVGPASKDTIASLYESYKSWCETNRQKPIGATWFGRRLADHGFIPWKSGSTRGWKGLEVRLDPHEER